jgi:hypothetical protein
MTPTCPVNYRCVFTPAPPKQHLAHWWDGSAGTWVAILALVAIVVIVVSVSYYIWQARTERLRLQQAERQRAAVDAQQRYLAEQRTLLADAAKGNPEVLQILERLK